MLFDVATMEEAATAAFLLCARSRPFMAQSRHSIISPSGWIFPERVPPRQSGIKLSASDDKLTYRCGFNVRF